MRPSTDISRVMPRGDFLGISSFEFWIVLAAIGLLVVLFVAWAVLIRKPKRDRALWQGISFSTKSKSHHGEHRRRRRRRHHRPRNPTLAETGGLPPVRREPPPGL